ncbi:uncharacterized protein FMAN_15394 [Fusarium mangiferae]|uniref:Uncharacterized protein n=1 Tax=Fusarium mangiferae TaxID=192010 RepID=A0A1L7UHW7_FUSMA|nr:uncharacterized protein FMAN_15394 [Fusarium mangiferae]CVL07327.1 uncharacterized protein FMAN_15394 [Fusarium mangiferae]
MEAVTPTPLAISNVRLDPPSFTPFSAVPVDLVKVSSASSILHGVQLAMKNIANMERRDHRSLALSGLQSLFIPNICDVLGQAGQDRVKNMDPDTPVYQSVMLDFHKALISQYHSLTSASRYSDIITDFCVNNNHEARISSMLNISSYATSIVWDETVVLAMIKALPMGSILLYIWKNLDDIRNAEPSFLTSGDSAARKLVLLGLHNLTGLSKTMSYTDKDVELVGFNATTTGLHALDGKNAWVVGRNQTMKSVGELIFTNTLQGIHKVMFGDLANCLLGESLMTAAHFRWQVHHRALTMDVPVEAVLHMMPAPYIDEYYRLEGYWTMADFARMPFNLRCIQVGANTDFTKSETTMVVALTEQDIVAQLTKPDKTLISIDHINSAGAQGTLARNPTAEEGVMLDGVQIADSFAATANPGDPISTAKKAGWYSGASLDNIRGAKTFLDGITAAINRAKVRLSTADPATWATMTPSQWELAIRNDWEFQREGQAITKDVFVEDIVKQFSDELPSMIGFISLLAGNQYVLMSGLAKTHILDVTGAIDGGLVSGNIRYATVEAAVHDITLAQVMTQIDRVNNAVTDAQAILQAKQDMLIAQKDKLSQDEIDLQEAEIKEDQNDIYKLNQQKAEFQDVQQMQSDPQHSTDRIKEAQDGIDDAQQSITNPGEV